MYNKNTSKIKRVYNITMTDITFEKILEARKNIDIRNEIISQLWPLVVKASLPYDASLWDDLRQEGIFGIIDAIEQADQKKLQHTKFTTFAFWKLRDRMSRFLTKYSIQYRETPQQNLAPVQPSNVTEEMIDLKKWVDTLPREQAEILLARMQGETLREIVETINHATTIGGSHLKSEKAIRKLRERLMEKIVIQYTPTTSQIIGKLPKNVEAHLYGALSYYPQGYEFSNAYIEQRWDGIHRLFSLRTYKFGSGLIHRVANILREHQIDFEVNSYPFVNPLNYQISKIQLSGFRSYQIEAIQEILKMKRGGIAQPPRTGKTYTAAGAIMTINNYPTIFLCFSLEIALQTKEKFEQLLQVPIGFIGDGVCSIQNVTICTVQSALAAYNKKWDFAVVKKEEKAIREKHKIRTLVESAKVVIVDEYHHYACESASFIASRLRSANYIIGLSATPWRTYEDESILLEKNIGPVIFSQKYSYFIERGYLLPAHIYIYKLPATPKRTNYYPTIYKEFIIENSLRNEIIKRAANKLVKQGKSVVIIISKIKHGEILKSLLPHSELLTGKEPTEVRQRVLKKLNKKEVKIVISTLLDEGVDIPSLDAVIIAAGGKSSIKVFQRLRCITPYKDKKFGIVIDFEDRSKYLQKHSRERIKIYKEEEAFTLFFRKIELDKNNKIKIIPQ